MTASPRDSSRLERVVQGLAVFVIGCAALLVMTFGYGRDQGIYALVARSICEGDMPYRDAFDFKPPGIFLVYALARGLFGPAQWGVRVLEALGLVATSAAMVSLATRLWGDRTIGFIAAALAALVHAQLDFWHTAQPETFGGMLTIAGIWLVVEPVRVTVPMAARALNKRRLVLAGLAFGLAGLMKPPLAGGGAMVALWYGLQRMEPGSLGPASLVRAVAAPARLVLAGGVVPFALCLAWFWAQGALAALYDVLFVFTPHYTALSWQDRTLLGLVYQSFTNWLTIYSSLVTIGLLVGLAAFDPCFRRRGVSLLALIAAVQLVGVALQGKFFPYHYAAVWPVTALLAGLGWAHVLRAAQTKGPIAVAGFALAVVLAAQLRTATKDLSDSFWSRAAKRVRLAADGLRDKRALDALASVADVNMHGNRMVAEELSRRVRPGGYVFIWGFEPVIYDLSELRPASRYIYNVAQRVAWARDSARAELMRELAARPPEAVVVAHGDVFPMVTGSVRGSAEVLELEFEGLRDLLRREYVFHARIDDFDLYLRDRDEPPRSTPRSPRRSPGAEPPREP
ncbi:MAG: hypothetical protein EXR75_12010 [Myxococcales bacterium]|nr:hypothetical protein [Myxococcales bacterium]